jgi:hypothetical protein
MTTLVIPQETNFCVVLILSTMKDMEWVLPNPSVDMTVEDLGNLWHQLKKKKMSKCPPLMKWSAH